MKHNEEKYTNKDFKDALNELKKKRKLSYSQISIKSGLSAPYIFDLAKGKLLPPKDKNMVRIAKAMVVEPEYFKEYRHRRLAEKLGAIDFDNKNCSVVLSTKEIRYLQKVIGAHLTKNK